MNARRARQRVPAPIQPRPYQVQAVRALLRGVATPHSGLIIIPTGGGKTPVMAWSSGIIQKSGGKVLCLAHRVELVEQHRAVGLWSTTIQAFYLAKHIPHVDVLFIDEAHMIPDGEFQQYRAVIKGLRIINPSMRVVGFTATPSRYPNIPLEGTVFAKTWYSVSKEYLLRHGWLTPLVHKACFPRIAMQDRLKAANEDQDYTRNSLRAAEDPEVTAGLVREVEQSRRKAVLVFCTSVRHAEDVARALNGDVITQNTTPRQRRIILENFKQNGGRLVNCEVLTTGFDAPNIDAIGKLRPTRSKVLNEQMDGRGMRLYPGKKDCLILDFCEPAQVEDDAV